MHQTNRFLLLATVLLALLMTAACQPLELPAGDTAANVALVRSNFLDAWNNFNLDAVDAAFAAEYVGHLPGMEVEGIDGHKALITTFLTAFPDWTFTIEEQWAFDDKVVTLWSVTGTHAAELMGIPPTGQTINVTGTDVHRIEDGKVVEAWVEFNQLRMMEQLGFALAPAEAGAPAEASAPAAFVETLATFDAGAGHNPEGVAVDSEGNAYVSIMSLGEVWRVAPDGNPEVVAHFPDASVVGMTTDSADNLYVAVGAEDPALNGVVRVAPDGTFAHIPGTEGMSMANAMVLAPDGTLYVSDNIAGAVWRAPQDGVAELWVTHAELQGTEELGFGIPIGANGIGFFDDTVYVANTEKHQIVAIPVSADGTAGEPWVAIATDDLVFDGITMDDAGRIYAVAIAQSQLLRMNPQDGTITVLADATDGLDWPASVALGQGKAAGTIYIANFAIGPEGGAGPGLLKMTLGQ